MAENEFEKRVQQKMDGFNLDPTPAVWKSVEARIRKEKKRRFLFWWLLLLAGGIGTTVWLATGRQEREQLSDDIKKMETGTAPVEELNKENISEHDSVETVRVFSIPVAEQKILTDDKSIEVKNNSIKNNNSPVRRIQVPVKLEMQNEFVLDNKDKEVIRNIEHAEVKSKKQEEVNNPASMPQQTVVNKKEENPLVNPASPFTQQPVINTDSPVVKLKSKDEKQSSNKWGISLSTGTSAFMNKFSFFKNSFFRVDALQSAPGSPLSNPNRTFTFRRGFSFSAEFFVKRPVSPKLTLSGSMGYQYLSTRLLTGSRVNASNTINNWASPGVRVSSYYNIPGISDNGYYTNRFHFLSLSGELSWRFVSGKKFSLLWNNGLSYSRLITSTMLHYDYNQRVYYRDNNLLLKNQLFYNTALEIPVTKKLSISPFLSFSITPVLKVDDSLGRRYNNQGFRIRYLLNKK